MARMYNVVMDEAEERVKACWFNRCPTIFLVTALLCCLLAAPAWAVTIITGSYTGDGTDDRNIVISPACTPKFVAARNNGLSTDFYFLTASMGTNQAGQWVGSDQVQADRIQQMNSDGFQVGTLSNVNTNVYRYLAICDNGANDLAEGTYAGNNADNRDIAISPALRRNSSCSSTMRMPTITPGVARPRIPGIAPAFPTSATRTPPTIFNRSPRPASRSARR